MRRRKNFTITPVPPPELTSEDGMVADCVGMNPPPANNMDPSPPWSKCITTKSNSTATLRLLFLQIPIEHSFFALNISYPQSRNILIQKLPNSVSSQFTLSRSCQLVAPLTWIFFVSLAVNISPSLPPSGTILAPKYNRFELQNR